MKNQTTSAARIIILLIAVLASSSFAQSRNELAIRWFNIGVKEKDPQEKIAAYLKAVQTDPQFSEAFYNLGVTYRTQANYDEAFQSLEQALQIETAAGKESLRSAIFQEMATIHQIQNRPNEYERSLREAIAFASDKEKKSNLLFKLGKFLFEQNRLDEAKMELEAGRKLASTGQSFFDNYISFVEAAVQYQQQYERAVRSMAAGNHVEAKTIFEEIRANDPNFKDVTAKLQQIDSLLAVAASQQARDTLHESALRYEQEGNLFMAISLYRSLLDKDSTDHEAADKLQAVTADLEKSKRTESLSREYARGLQAMEGADWAQAAYSFERVFELNPNYREVRRLLGETKRKLNQRSTDAVIARYYFDGLAAMNRGDLEAAMVAFEKVQAIDPAYKNAEALLENIAATVQRKYESQTARVLESTQLDSLYQVAAVAMADANWSKAIAALEQVNQVRPDYRDAANLLAYAKSTQQMSGDPYAERAVQARGLSFPYVAGILAAVLLLPLTGFIVFSPMTRARLLVLRGEYDRAAKIYEKLLERNPSLLKLYEPLANIYLLSGRRDDHALKIYRMILQLNLARHRHDEINALMAQNYLEDGRRDHEAIKVLENALESHYRLQASTRVKA